jgi:hypothetical protein
LAVYSQLLLGLVHRTVWWCIGQCPVRQTSLDEQATLGTRRRRTAIIHRTVRWSTRLSGESSAAKSSLSGKVQRRMSKIHRTFRWCTGLSGEPTVDYATVGSEICGRHVARTNGRKGTPDCPVCTRQCPVCQPTPRCNGRLRQKRKEIRTGPPTVAVRWHTGLPGAPPTEGNLSLPCWSPTAPSCHGAIKGTLGAWRSHPSIL